MATHNLQANANLAFNNAPITSPITWFPDTGANHHVTPDLASMTSSEPYCGNDHLHVGDGKGLTISNIAHSKIRSPKCTFTLSNILHMPHIKKPLLSIQKFCLENNVFFEFHSFLFYVKDLMTKEVLLSGRSRDGLYILFALSATSLPQVFSSTCVSTSTNVWHRRLGHPSPCILNFLVSTKQASCTSKQFNFNCPASPMGKSSRLTLKTTSHQTQAPLDLIFSDVWGLSPMFLSDGFRYFVIFVDAHTKFIWFYPLVAKSDVFAIFHQLQALVERQFSLKSIATPPSIARTHSMMLRPRVSKTTNFSVSPAFQVVSLPQQEPFSFKDANQYLIWHNAMTEEIKALHGNHTWSLVPLHPSMNVVGSR